MARHSLLDDRRPRRVAEMQGTRTAAGRYRRDRLISRIRRRLRGVDRRLMRARQNRMGKLGHAVRLVEGVGRTQWRVRRNHSPLRSSSRTARHNLPAQEQSPRLYRPTPRWRRPMIGPMCQAAPQREGFPMREGVIWIVAATATKDLSCRAIISDFRGCSHSTLEGVDHACDCDWDCCEMGGC